MMAFFVSFFLGGGSCFFCCVQFGDWEGIGDWKVFAMFAGGYGGGFSWF